MTDVDVVPFTRRVTELVVSRGKAPDDVAIRGCFTLLRDLDYPDVMRACDWSARHDTWFPDAVKIRKAVAPSRDGEARGVMTAETAAALSAGDIWCRQCQDTGFAWVNRASGHLEATPPVGSHADYQVRPCVCRSSNTLWQARRAREPRKTAQERES